MYAIRVRSGEKLDLAKLDASVDGGMEKEDGLVRADDLGKELTELQELLYAAGQTPLLIVLQGRDTSGKDGTIRFLLRYLNAQGTRVASFKVPTPVELAHDYLWRCHAQTPGKGETVIFNRSHYEDVLVVRVHELAPEEVWKKRFGHINDWEKLLTDCGTTVIKIFLHISKDEQEQRLMEREQEVEKAWKLSVGDWKEREHWDSYTRAFEDALSRCSTDEALDAMLRVHDVLACDEGDLFRNPPGAHFRFDHQLQGRYIADLLGRDETPRRAGNLAVRRMLFAGKLFAVAAEGETKEIAAQGGAHRSGQRGRRFRLPGADGGRPHGRSHPGKRP